MSLEQLGGGSTDMLMMLMEQSQAPVAPAARRPSPGAAMSDAAAMAANPIMQQARELVQVARNDRELLARMRRQGAADLAAAVEAGDLANVMTHLQRLMDQRRQAEAGSSGGRRPAPAARAPSA